METKTISYWEAGKLGYSPWGYIDHVTKFTTGLSLVNTPGHGGLRVSKSFASKMPDIIVRMGTSYGSYLWYEEDCLIDVAICGMEQQPDIFNAIATYYKKEPAEFLESCKRVFRNYYPDEYEKFYKVELKPGESSARDNYNFLVAHSNDLITRAAWGDWHKTVPKGFVGVCAYPGRLFINDEIYHHEHPDGETWYLIPEQEYKATHGYFVIDTARHGKWEPHA